MSIDITPMVSASLTERVAEEIRVVLTRRRIKQSQLARALGVSEQWVSVRMRGVQPIDLNDLEKIAIVLGVEVVDLMPRTGGRLTTSSGPQADPRAGTNARSTRPAERPTLTGQRQRADGRESTRRPARTVPMIPALMTDDVMAELLETRAA